MQYFKRRLKRAFKVSCIIIFGEYIHSGSDQHSEYVVYKYKGEEHKVPNLFGEI